MLCIPRLSQASVMFFTSQNSIMHGVLLCIISLLAINASATSTAKSSSAYLTTTQTSSLTTLSTSSTKDLAVQAPMVTVTITSIQYIANRQAPFSTITLPVPTVSLPVFTTTVCAATTCTPGAPCSLYESLIPSCVLRVVQQEFSTFQPNCFSISFGPNFVSSCICPYLSQLPGFFSSYGLCPGANVAGGLAYQQSECQCLEAPIG